MSGSIGPWLAQKYSILQQEADARTAAQRSQSAYQAGMLPANVAQLQAQAGLLGAQTTTQNQLRPGAVAAQDIGNRDAEVESLYKFTTPFLDVSDYLRNRTGGGMPADKKPVTGQAGVGAVTVPRIDIDGMPRR